MELHGDFKTVFHLVIEISLQLNYVISNKAKSLCSWLRRFRLLVIISAPFRRDQVAHRYLTNNTVKPIVQSSSRKAIHTEKTVAFQRVRMNNSPMAYSQMTAVKSVLH